MVGFWSSRNDTLSDGGGVGHHAHSALDTGQVTSGNNGRGLVVDSALEAGRAPVDELHGALGLDGSDGRVDILGDDVTTVLHAARHELSVTGVALGHHVGGLEHSVGALPQNPLHAYLVRSYHLCREGLPRAALRPGDHQRCVRALQHDDQV